MLRLSQNKWRTFIAWAGLCVWIALMPAAVRAAGDAISSDLLLVNRWTLIADTYQPVLVNVKIKGLFLDKPGFQLDKTAAAALEELILAAAQEGCSGYILTSAYRNCEYQKELYEDKIARLKERYGDRAEEIASTMVAAPGASEHHTGLAADLSSWEWENADTRLVADFSKTRTGRWLQENSWKYGWIARYPAHKQAVTGIIPEPWHFRYVGKPHAEIMYQHDLALEEYYDFLDKQGVFDYAAIDGAVYKIAVVKEKSAVDMMLRLAPPDIRVSETNQQRYILTLRLSAP